MNKSKNITIVLASDNHFAILLAALVKSIEVNHKTGEFIDFYVIDDGISTANKQKIQRSVQSEKIIIHWLDATKVTPPTITVPNDGTASPLNTYFRLFAPDIVPQDVERILYMDVDMIVLEDISKLWYTDLRGKMCGAVHDRAKVVSNPWGGIPNYKELGMDPEDPYFNAGLLLIDAKAWRAADMTNQVFKAIHDNMKVLLFADQYGLNVAMVNQWYELDPRWAWIATEDSNDPYIVHYIAVKPIFKSYQSVPEFKTLFFSYLEQTAWKGFKPISGNYRLARKMYNKVKKVVLRHLKSVG